MNEELKKKLESAISACAINAQMAKTAIDALQYTQAALNAANALTCLHLNVKN
jgi:hypothetical protein